MSIKSDSRIYIGNLPPDVRTKDLEDLFYKYGKIRFIDLKNRKPGPPFAFIEFEDHLDADDAIRGRDNYDFDGYRLRVEFQKGPRGGRGRMMGGGPGGGGGGGGYDGGRDSRGGGGGGGGSNNAPPRRSENRVIITGLPTTGSWQDLKDHMRVAGNVCYADVFKDGTGVVEFIHYEDAKYAVKHLDDTKFRSHEGETTYVRVKMDGRRRSPSRSRSPRSRSGSRRRHGSRQRERSSPSYSPVRRSRSPRSRSRSGSRGGGDDANKRSSAAKKSRSRSRSRSPSQHSRTKSKSKSKSRSRSRSRSPHAAADADNATANGYDA